MTYQVQLLNAKGECIELSFWKRRVEAQDVAVGYAIEKLRDDGMSFKGDFLVNGLTKAVHRKAGLLVSNEGNRIRVVKLKPANNKF